MALRIEIMATSGAEPQARATSVVATGDSPSAVEKLPMGARVLKDFVDHPITKLVVGLILIVTSSAEAYYSFHDDLSQFRVRAHHGLIVLGFINVLAAIPNLVQGFQHYIEFRAKSRELLRLKRGPGKKRAGA